MTDEEKLESLKSIRLSLISINNKCIELNDEYIETYFWCLFNEIEEMIGEFENAK